MTIMRAKMFTVYAFDDTFQQYVRILQMESEGLFNLLLPALPYKHVYIKRGRGEKTINKYFGLKLEEIQTQHIFSSNVVG